MKGLTSKTKRDLDRLARAVVFDRDRHRCARCSSRSLLQWAHVQTRRILATRWMLENSMVLCAGCHLWWHHYPLISARWFRKTFPKRALALDRIHGKVDKTKTAQDWSDYLEQRGKRAAAGQGVDDERSATA